VPRPIQPGWIKLQARRDRAFVSRPRPPRPGRNRHAAAHAPAELPDIATRNAHAAGWMNGAKCGDMFPPRRAATGWQRP
jgi:hypothetical protein